MRSFVKRMENVVVKRELCVCESIDGGRGGRRPIYEGKSVTVTSPASDSPRALLGAVLGTGDVTMDK